MQFFFFSFIIIRKQVIPAQVWQAPSQSGLSLDQYLVRLGKIKLIVRLGLVKIS